MPKKSNAIALFFLSLNGTLLCMNNAKKPLSEKELLTNGVVVLQQLPASLQSVSLGYYGLRGAANEPLSAFKTTRRNSLLSPLACSKTSLIAFQEESRDNDNWRITASTTYLSKGAPKKVFTIYTLNKKFGKIGELTMGERIPARPMEAEKTIISCANNPAIIACLLQPHKPGKKPRIEIAQNDQHLLALALEEVAKR